MQRLSCSLLLLLGAVVGLSDCFYLPGVAPQDFPRKVRAICPVAERDVPPPQTASLPPSLTPSPGLQHLEAQGKGGGK